MNKLIVAALTLSMSSLAAGCIGPCGGYTGGSDRVLARGNDSIILCENTGFITTMATGVIEGTYVTNPDSSVSATRGDTAATAFILTWGTDGTAETTDLGDGAWTQLSLNATELDHANIQCTDLASRSWWSAQ